MNVFYKKSNSSLVNADRILNELQSSINDLKSSIDLDSNIDKNNNILAKQESLKSKVKESGVTLERTKNVIWLIVFKIVFLQFSIRVFSRISNLLIFIIKILKTSTYNLL